NRALTVKVTELEEHNRALQEHNRELTVAATERAQKLQDREAELTQALVAMGQRVEQLSAHNRELTVAATEKAQKLQDREAELTQALDLQVQRIERLSKHNIWLTENAIEAVREMPALFPETNEQRGVLEKLIMQQLQQMDDDTQGSVTQQLSLESSKAELRVREPSDQSCSAWSNSLAPIPEGGGRQPRYMPRKKHVLMVTSSLARGGCERRMLATANGLLRRGYNVELFCFTTPDYGVNFMEEFSQLGIKCHHPAEFADSIVGADDDHNAQSLQK